MENPFLKQLSGSIAAYFMSLARITIISLSLLALITSCEKAMEGEIYKVYDDKMIDELLVEYQLTSFLSVVDKADMTGTIHAYGTYTLFAPTNEALTEYLQELGKNGVDALSKEEAADIVTYHLVRDTLGTADFVDGRLATPNFQKKYLMTKYEASGTIVNRLARIIENDIHGANGILHIVDKVLTSPENSITDAVRALPEDYSLYKSFFEASGWADSLDVEREDLWYTLFIQDDQAFEDAGITNTDDLLAQLREFTPAVENNDTLIYNYIGYHTIKTRLYITDLMYLTSMQTVMPKQVITFKRNMDVILLNELIQGQITEPGIPLDRTSDYSDLNCSNGVVHKINGNIQIKNRSAYRIYWDITEQPEIMALLNFRKKGANVDFNPGELSEIQWGGPAPSSINYYCQGYSSVLDEKFQYVYGDYLRFNIYSKTTSWMEMKTPVLVEGKYKVWVCYRRELELNLKTTFKQEGYDDQVLPYVINLSEYMPNPESSSHEQLEIDGWKQYNAKKYNSVVNSRLLGIIDVQTTGQHILRFEPTTGGRGQQAGSWDIIQFIPIDEDQIWPRMDILGNWIGPEVRVCEIWPYDDCGDEPVEE